MYSDRTGELDSSPIAFVDRLDEESFRAAAKRPWIATVRIWSGSQAS